MWQNFFTRLFFRFDIDSTHVYYTHARTLQIINNVCIECATPSLIMKNYNNVAVYSSKEVTYPYDIVYIICTLFAFAGSIIIVRHHQLSPPALTPYPDDP